MLHRESSFIPTFPVKGTVDFIHTTQRAGGYEQGSAYVQDWNRVVPSDQAGNINLYSDYDGYLGYQGLNYTQYVYWQESFEEKCNDVWNTFLLSVQDNQNQQGSTFYINSLDGYYINRSIQQSYIPYIEGYSENYTPYGNTETSFSYGQGGMSGNIEGFAEDINEYFYNKLLEYGTDNIYGSMNIVIMDRVYADDPSSYLPSVIINNNYRFPLLTNEEAANQSESQFNNGGNAIK